MINLISHVKRLIPDKLYIEIQFYRSIGKWPNLRNPKTFNEKIQWLKLYDRKPEYTTMVDKYEVKRYIADKIGEEYIIPTIGIWDRVEDIQWQSLPTKFVIKCTHDSGSVCICKDKTKFDFKAAEKKLRTGLKNNGYWFGREWPYKNVKPRIIAEKYIEDNRHIVPEDYKIYCFNGKPRYIVVYHDRFSETKQISETVYDVNWQPQSFSFNDHYLVNDNITPKPDCLPKLLELCEKICQDYPQLRIDFYIISNVIYFGEITFLMESDFQTLLPEKMNQILKKKINLDYSNMGGYKLDKDWTIILCTPDMKKYENEIGNNNGEISDYKLMCFNGKVKSIFVCTERFSNDGLKVTFFDRNWKRMPFKRRYHPPSKKIIPAPPNLSKMIKIAEKIAKDMPFVRVDLYDIDDRILFGELTLFPGSGFEEFIPYEGDKKMGSWIRLPENCRN